MDALLRSLVEAASWAPSAHNSQPWRFRISGGILHAGLETARLLPALDPADRFAWVSLGAAVECARLAALRAGCDVEVRWFESELTKADIADVWPVAIQPVPTRGIPQQDLDLATWIEHQAVVRGSMAERPSPAGGCLEEAAVAALPSARLVELAPGRRALLVDLAERVTLVEYSQRDLRRELLAWTRTFPLGTPRDGVRCSELATSRTKKVIAPLVLSRPLVVPLGMPRRLAREARAIVGTAPTFVAVTGASADPAGWFDTGRGWQRSTLALARRGFATHWLTAVLALAEAPIRDLFETSAAEPMALVVRVGKPVRATGDSIRLRPDSLLR